MALWVKHHDTQHGQQREPTAGDLNRWRAHLGASTQRPRNVIRRVRVASARTLALLHHLRQAARIHLEQRHAVGAGRHLDV